MITGSNGFIGSYMSEYLRGIFKVFQTDKTFDAGTGSEDSIFMDITDANLVGQVMSQYRPDIVLHLAAIKDVGFCEGNPEEARRTNCYGTRNILEACAQVGAFPIYLSSDYVFEGNKGMYAEKDVRHPLTIYGKTKKESEDLVMNFRIPYCVCRSGAVYGHSMRQSPLLTWATEKFKKGELIDAFVNVYSTPTCVYDLCEAIELIAEERRQGILHIAGCQRVSRRDFLKAYALSYGFDPDLVGEEEYRHTPSLHSFRRPTDLSLNAVASEKKLEMRFLNVREGFEALKRFDR